VEGGGLIYDSGIGGVEARKGGWKASVEQSEKLMKIVWMGGLRVLP
jgi:hypothetical protein